MIHNLKKRNDFGERRKILFLIIGKLLGVDRSGKRNHELIFCVGVLL
jgi:hypothetical protein